MENSTVTTDEVRNRVVFYLLFLTSKICFDACSKLTSPEKFIFQLSKTWFNDVFVPGKVFITQIKSGYSEEDSKLFQDCFDVEEYDVLERFHLFYDLRLNMLSDKNKKEGVFPINDSWENIVKDARHVLDEIVPNQTLLREKLEKEVMEAIEKNKNVLDTFWK